MPEMTRVTPVMFLGPVMRTMSPKARSAPANAAASSHSLAASGKKAERTTIASHPPDEVPSVRGEVIGFCVSCCRRHPTRPRMTPPKMAAESLGSVP